MDGLKGIRQGVLDVGGSADFLAADLVGQYW
jgi:hypothetical protein